ncbi:MAG: TlpA family protein disulfide reductase [Candidatus Dormibacteria bacterium]
MRPLIIAIVAVGLVVLLFKTFGAYGGGGVARGGGGPAMIAGAPAASFEIASLAGGTSSVAAYRGKVVLVNLWASWCAPCRAEAPSLERLYRAGRQRGLVVLGIDEGEAASSAAGFARTFGITYPILLDADQRYGRAYDALGLPTTVIVDRGGRVVRGIDGELTFEQMQAAIAPVLVAR